MNSNILFIGLMVLLVSSCKPPGYLPASDKMGVNEYGSYIKVVRWTASSIDGELIAIDSTKIVVLTEDKRKCVAVPVSEVKRFSLHYARPRRYWWTIPVGIALPFIHGVFSIFTFPLHLIVTTSVTVGGENAFRYSNRNMTYGKLKMFARFPQGIPATIDIASIK